MCNGEAYSYEIVFIRKQSRKKVGKLLEIIKIPCRFVKNLSDFINDFYIYLCYNFF